MIISFDFDKDNDNDNEALDSFLKMWRDQGR
jgi:hypothetical protein